MCDRLTVEGVRRLLRRYFRARLGGIGIRFSIRGGEDGFINLGSGI